LVDEWDGWELWEEWEEWVDLVDTVDPPSSDFGAACPRCPNGFGAASPMISDSKFDISKRPGVRSGFCIPCVRAVG
jgi:hypothetical protein